MCYDELEVCIDSGEYYAVCVDEYYTCAGLEPVDECLGVMTDCLDSGELYDVCITEYYDCAGIVDCYSDLYECVGDGGGYYDCFSVYYECEDVDFANECVPEYFACLDSGTYVGDCSYDYYGCFEGLVADCESIGLDCVAAGGDPADCLALTQECIDGLVP